MKTAIRAAFVVSTGTTFGAMLFLLAIAAQVIFSSAPLNIAGHLITRVFPPYYTLTGVLSALSFLSSFTGPVTPLKAQFCMYHGISFILNGAALLATFLALTIWAIIATIPPKVQEDI